MFSLTRNAFFFLVYAVPNVEDTLSFTQHRNTNNYKEMGECAYVREVKSNNNAKYGI